MISNTAVRQHFGRPNWIISPIKFYQSTELQSLILADRTANQVDIESTVILATMLGEKKSVE